MQSWLSGLPSIVKGVIYIFSSTPLSAVHKSGNRAAYNEINFLSVTFGWRGGSFGYVNKFSIFSIERVAHCDSWKTEWVVHWLVENRVSSAQIRVKPRRVWAEKVKWVHMWKSYFFYQISVKYWSILFLNLDFCWYLDRKIKSEYLANEKIIVILKMIY